MKIKLSKTETQMDLFKNGIGECISYSQLATIAYVMFYIQASPVLFAQVFSHVS